MSLSVQFFSLLAMIGTGIVAAAMIDMIGTGTAHAGKKSFVRRHAVIIEVIGWIIAGCWTFTILYTVRDGAWRIYDPFAQLSGMLLYASFFHKPFRVVGKVILLVIIKPIWLIFRAIVSVINRLFLFIIWILTLLSKPFVSIFRKLNRKLFKIKWR
ncbi:spore cortex biosynthesis protein YabQ [Sporosarcina pasteurii]|uniref:Spore cortex biosynthesis protein YabQ n=1 Tax=Sporosarcina pasteurii TaxID=1474 RepID=A0A380BAX4_SPOPA|nr:spore cortex biosynthesis protein YabQ [Sporosarcina pasteurii]MDS9473282.1 hypothetical protein [Sporosarcina pasteurii]QBQ06512.1 hypothetical protein E2C16_13030 [Sporosarcina pasteurii]SUI98287.1 spore cortex biosynthesis protein YabQ [Sporosarcina pasteurii]